MWNDMGNHYCNLYVITQMHSLLFLPLTLSDIVCTKKCGGIGKWCYEHTQKYLKCLKLN